MRGLRTDATAQVIIAGHAFIQNLRRGHYELGIDAPATAGRTSQPTRLWNPSRRVLGRFRHGGSGFHHIRPRALRHRLSGKETRVQPWWLLLPASAALLVGLASSTVIVVDTYLRGYRQAVKIMELVWPVTALYFGPAAVAAYWLWGRPQAPRWRQRHGNPPKRRRRADVLTELCHSGAHCTLGVIIGEVAVFATGITLGGETLWAGNIGDYLIAIALSFAFRYSLSAYRGGRRIRTTLANLAKAGLPTISAFEFVLFACLALLNYVIFPGPILRPNSPTFWFFVQIGLIGGYFATWPVTVWMTHLGVKFEPPDTLH